MEKKYYLFWANMLFLIHLAVVCIILFGWLWGSYVLRHLYIWTLVLTLSSETVAGYCVLTKWEFDLRKRLELALQYDYSFLSYYGYKILGPKIPRKLVKYSALTFLISFLIINISRYS